MDLLSLVDHLKQQFRNPLPGRKAQLALFSEKGLKEYEEHVKLFLDDETKPTRQSSVLILLYEKDEKIHLPLILRNVYEGTHSGQVGLPGGKVEPEDKDVLDTALRETYEEIGIAPSQVSVLGILTPVFIPPSRFWVNIVVGYYSGKPEFIPDPREVAKLIELPLEHLLETGHIEEREVIRHQEFRMKAPGYVFEEYFIWGATSMVLTEFKSLVASC